MTQCSLTVNKLHTFCEEIFIAHLNESLLNEDRIGDEDWEA